jgi:hypothetical protein
MTAGNPASDTFDEHLVMFINEVESAITRNERRYDLPILNQLDTNGLSHRTVWLARFDSHFL